MVRPDRMRDEIERVAADPRHRARAVEHEAVGAVDPHRKLAPAHVVDAEMRVEQADERPDRARGVVVLRLAEQERAPALEVAQVHVVAERRADDPVRGVDDEDDLRLGVVPSTSDAGRRHRRCRSPTSVAPS